MARKKINFFVTLLYGREKKILELYDNLPRMAKENALVCISRQIGRQVSHTTLRRIFQRRKEIENNSGQNKTNVMPLGDATSAHRLGSSLSYFYTG